MAKYLIRFDDINSRIDWEKFFILKKCLEEYNIKSILGVVPNCKDNFLFSSKPLNKYYDFLRQCKIYGDTIAQHGYEHLYDSKADGFFGNSNNSEFAGHDFKKQFIKLSEGKKILEKESLWEPIFMAPAHSLDLTTLKALNKLGFKTVLDGYSLFPYKFYNLIFVPQIFGKPLPSYMPCISQLCIHINTISEKDLRNLILFIKKYYKNFISLEELNISKYPRSMQGEFFISFFVQIYRQLKHIINILNSINIKLLCIYQRIVHRIKLRNFNVDKWHLNGTFYCRRYKILSLKLINNLKPNIYIDIGCGLGDLLSKVKISKELKLGYDKDSEVSKANIKFKKNKFKYFTEEEKLVKYVIKLNSKNNNLIIISMLNFLHNLSIKEFEAKINYYKKELGSFLLLVDNIYDKGKEYSYNHHQFLFNHSGLIKYMHKVDKLRSLYLIKVN